METPEPIEALQRSVVRSLSTKNKLYILISGVTLIALLLVTIAMGIYNSSGAAQLDLSGPGFKDVQKGVQEEKDATSYPSNGAFDKASFESFKKMYDERVHAVNAINGYDPAAVNNDSFNLVPESTQPTN